MKRGWLLLAAGILIMGVGSFAAVRGLVGTAQGPQGCCAAWDALYNYLQLDAGQRQAIARVDADALARRAALRERLWQARDRLVAVLKNPESDISDGREAVRAFGEAQQALQSDTVEHVYAIRKHLTPEQRAKLSGMLGRGICGVVCGQGPGRGGWKGGGRGRCGFGQGLGAER